MRFLRLSMTGLFLAAVALGLLAYAAQTVGSAVQVRLSEEPRTSRAREREFSVNTIIAQPATVQPILETYGEIDARRRLEVRAAVSGRVVGLADAFEDGGKVSQDELLVQIDPAETQAAVERLSADVQDAIAEQRDAARGLELARAEVVAAEDQTALRGKAFDRQQDLGNRGVGTSAAIEEAELAAASARANVLARQQAVAQAEARVDQAKTQLQRAEIALAEAQRERNDTAVKAPFAGILSDTAVIEGGIIAVNERLADLIDPSDLEVAFRLSTAQYARLLDEDGALITANVTVMLEVVGVDLSTTGQLARVSASTGERQTGRVVFARLLQPAGFRPGDFVTVHVTEPPAENVVRLPAAALGSDGHVLVIGENSRLEALAVTLVRRQGDDVLVRGDTLDGREVVTARTPLLGPGTVARPLRSLQQTTANTPEMLELSDERRARLVAFVEASERMPQDAKARALAQLSEPQVPARMVERLERRMGG